MRSLACIVTLLTGCLYSDPEVSLADLRSLELEFFTSGPGLRVQLDFADMAIDPCSVLPHEVHAEFDGIPLTLDPGGGGTSDGEFCEEPYFWTEEPRAASGSHTFLLEDGSRTIALDLGENMLKRTLATIPPGPFEFIGGQTYTFQTNVPKDLERGFTAAIHPTPGSYVGLTPIVGPGGTFTLTMPLQELGGTLDTQTIMKPGKNRILVDGVGCYFPNDSHGVSTPVHVTSP